jgi:hypothetical protein
MGGVMPRSALERTLARVVHTPEGCWRFTGAHNREGYGMVNEGGKSGRMKLVHRVVYEAMVGPIPEGHVLDHVYERCQFRDCCNPEHCEPVTNEENARRMWAAGRGVGDTRAAIRVRVARQRALTHCKRGHEFTPENTRVDSRGQRSCKACGIDQQRARRARKDG